jgi:uncharacterized protein YceH (UPF0502 family)
VDLEPSEIRVLGCLLEKQRTTPDAYPLTLNALRAACNQTTNRDPVVSYDDDTIRQALHKLGRRRWTRLASGHSSRAAKYRHLLAEELRLEVDEQAILAVLALRGPQTPGELKQRTERLHDFADMAAVETAVDKLVARGMAARLERRPGQKEARYTHLLGDEVAEVAAAEAPPVIAQAPPPAPVSQAPPRPAPVSSDGAAELEPRLARLESEVAELRAQLSALRDELGVE